MITGVSKQLQTFGRDPEGGGMAVRLLG